MEDIPNIKIFILGWIPESANDKYNLKTCLEINRMEINT